jgi:hypothetical protein
MSFLIGGIVAQQGASSWRISGCRFTVTCGILSLP